MKNSYELEGCIDAKYNRILEHDKIQAMHDAIYAGDYSEFPEIAKLEKFKQFHKEFMDYIRDIRTNRGR